MRKNIERVNNISQVSNHDNFNKNVLFQPMKLLHVQVFGPCRRRRAGVMLIQLFTNFENNQGIYWNLYSSTPHEIFIQNIYAHQNEEKVLNCESLLDRSELSRSRYIDSAVFRTTAMKCAIVIKVHNAKPILELYEVP